MSKRILAALALLAVVALAACGGSEKSDPGTVPAPTPVDRRGEAEVAVDAIDNAFEPPIVIVDAGTEVTWTNKGAVAHNVKKAFDPVDFGGQFGVEIGGFGPGASYSFTFDQPGTYQYTCTIHTGMDGEIRVEAPSSGASSTTTTSAG